MNDKHHIRTSKMCNITYRHVTGLMKCIKYIVTVLEVPMTPLQITGMATTMEKEKDVLTVESSTIDYPRVGMIIN